MISNSNPQPKDVVILQRDDANTYYGETHISASKAILHINSSGYLDADESASFYSLYPPSGYTGQLNDSTTTKIADIVGGVIVKVYF